MKQILFEGKVTLADHLVDFRIFKEFDEDENFLYYSYATNPQLRNKDQAEFHGGQTLRDPNLEKLLFKFEHCYKRDFSEIVEERENSDYQA